MRVLKVISACLLLGMSWSANATDEEDLTTMLNEFLWGASIGSAQAHESFWAEELIYTSSSGTRTDKEQIMGGMAGTPEPDDDVEPAVVYTAEDIDVRIYGDTAIVAFRLVGTAPGEPPDVDEYFNTGTFLRRDGEWRVIAWQATRIPVSEDDG